MSILEAELKKKKDTLENEMSNIASKLEIRESEYASMEIELKEVNTCLKAIDELWLGKKKNK